MLRLEYGNSLGQIEHGVIQSLLATIIKLICERLCGKQNLCPHVKLVEKRVELVVLQLVMSKQVNL